MEQLNHILSQFEGRQDSLFRKIQSNVIGHRASFTTSLGLSRQIVYCDYFASGRSLAFIENTIQKHILPFYANTHTTSTHTGLYTSQQRELARDAVRTACNAAKDDYAVIFTGSGSTSAIHHVVGSLRLLHSNHWPTDNPPVVFLSVMEHHSNLLPWRESVAEVVLIPMDAQGHGPDLAVLQTQLQAHQRAPLLVGAFSAGSNLTGVPLKVASISRLLRAHGALALFDYAGVGPYIPIDMVDSAADAIFLSPHKFIGGPGTPGVLVIRRALLSSSSVPARPGGGSVTWVTKDSTEYIQDHLEEREEAGTPDIIGSIRCGMAFAVKSAVNPRVIAAKEFATARNVLDRLMRIPNVRMLGDVHNPRVPVFTFVVESPYVNEVSGKQLLVHHDFVSTLLNDLFGIQTRAGCMCAALYGQYLLGYDVGQSAQDESESPCCDAAAVKDEAGNQGGGCPMAQLQAAEGTSPTAQLEQAGQVPASPCPILALASETPAKASSPCPMVALQQHPHDSRRDSAIIDMSTQASSASLNSTPSLSDSILTSAKSISSSTAPLATFKPGYVRLSFNYFTLASEINYVLRAIEFVATHGHLLVPYYTQDPRTAGWTIRPAAPRPACTTTEWTNRALKLLVGRSLNASAFADAHRLVQPAMVRRVCEAVASEADREWEAVVGTSDVRRQVREYVLPADVCRAVLC